MYKRLLHISPYFNSEKLKIWKHPPLKNPVQSVSISGHEKLLPNNLNNVSLLGNRFYKSSLQLSRRVKVELELASCIPRNRQSSPQRVEGEICRSSVSLGGRGEPRQETGWNKDGAREPAKVVFNDVLRPSARDFWLMLEETCRFLLLRLCPGSLWKSEKWKGAGRGERNSSPREKKGEKRSFARLLLTRGVRANSRTSERKIFTPDRIVKIAILVDENRSIGRLTVKFQLNKL